MTKRKEREFYEQQLKKLVAKTGLPLRRLPEVLDKSSEQILGWWSDRLHLPVKQEHFNRLQGILGMDGESLLLERYDVDLARKRIFEDVCVLPERYSVNQNSFLRTSYHIIKYLILTRGQKFADDILYKLNVSPLIYQDLNTRVNLNFFVDLLDAVAKAGLSREEMDSLSSVMFLTMHETRIGQIVGAAEDVPDVYSLLSKNFEFFDTNFDYSSQFVGKKYHLKTVLPLSRHKDIAEQNESIMRLMRYRQILLAWFPYLVGMNPLFPATQFNIKGGKLVAEYEFNLDLNPKPLSRLELV